jgi:hypothetical protein
MKTAQFLSFVRFCLTFENGADNLLVKIVNPTYWDYLAITLQTSGEVPWRGSQRVDVMSESVAQKVADFLILGCMKPGQLWNLYFLIQQDVSKGGRHENRTCLFNEFSDCLDDFLAARQ